MERVYQRRLTLREIIRRPLCRHEMRMAITPSAMVALYILAGLLDLMGLGVLFWVGFAGPALLGEADLVLSTSAVLVVTVHAAILMVPGLMAPAIAGAFSGSTNRPPLANSNSCLASPSTLMIMGFPHAQQSNIFEGRAPLKRSFFFQRHQGNVLGDFIGRDL